MTDRKDRSQNLKIGETVILDNGFNNASEVKVLHLTKYFAIVTDGNKNWQVMKHRLTSKLDILTEKILNL